jgi:hypothetical protein
MDGYFTPSQLASMFGGGESTWRLKAQKGEFAHAVKRGKTWFIPISDVNQIGRGYDKEFTEPQYLSPEYPNDPSSIVIAQNDDGRYGAYINEHWFGAAQSLVILEYLQSHRDWLVEKAQENELQSKNHQK